MKRVHSATTRSWARIVVPHSAATARAKAAGRPMSGLYPKPAKDSDMTGLQWCLAPVIPLAMANKEQLEILKRDVDEWNDWRADHPDVRPDLSGMDLENADLVMANLSEAD